MREGKDFGAVDPLSPFIGTISYMCFGLLEYAPITTEFTMFVVMCAFLFRRQIDPGCTDAQFIIITDIILDFKTAEHSTFSIYLPSKMGTPKVEGASALGGLLARSGIYCISQWQYLCKGPQN